MSNADHYPTTDPLFVGATRPAMLWRVTYSGVILNITLVMTLFLNVSNNPLILLWAAPIHLVMIFMTLKEPRFFDLLFFWLRTTSTVKFRRWWKGASYGA